MQQTRSYVRWLTVTGFASALFASACVITTDDPDGGGGSSGSAGAGARAGAGPAAGTGGGTAGTGTAGNSGAAPVSYVCDDDPSAPGTPNPTCSSGLVDDCNTCIETKCCAEYKECYGTDPGNQCGWGGPDNQGELGCMQLCAQDALEAQGVLGDDEILACSAQCTTSKEHGSTLDCTLIGGTTSAAFNCLKENCMTECIGQE